MYPATSNMHSAIKNPVVVEEYLATEVNLGRVFGPVVPTALPSVQISRFGVIPNDTFRHLSVVDQLF